MSKIVTVVILNYMLFLVLFNISAKKIDRTNADNVLKMKWHNVATDMPKEWYGSKDALRIAEIVLIAQKTIGGWEKNKPFQQNLSKKEKVHYLNSKDEIGATFDNWATTSELRFLANVYSRVPDERYKSAFVNGLNYIFESQYPNGGWPQFYPARNSVAYSSYITYNDNAMVNIMLVLRDICLGESDFSLLDISEAQKLKSQQAFDLGVDCILATQIVVNGHRTVWCAQHNEVTLAPAKARSYELASFSGSESADIVLLLMDIKNPSDKIIASVDGAVKWFKDNAIENTTLSTEEESGHHNLVIVADSTAVPVWARFYDLETGKPYFCDRDGVEKSAIADIGDERRNGYGWYSYKPQQVIDRYALWLDALSR